MMTSQIVRNRTERQAFWKEQLEACSRSGMSLQAFCKERGLSYSSLCSWKRRLGFSKPHKAKDYVQDTVAITVLPVPSRSNQIGARIWVDGVGLEFSDSTDPKWIAAVVFALGSSPRRASRC